MSLTTQENVMTFPTLSLVPFVAWSISHSLIKLTLWLAIKIPIATACLFAIDVTNGHQLKKKIWESGHVSVQPLAPPTNAHPYIHKHTPRIPKIPLYKHAEALLWVNIGVGCLCTERDSRHSSCSGLIWGITRQQPLSQSLKAWHPGMHNKHTNN